MTYGLDSSQFIRRARVNLLVFAVVGVDSGSNNRQLLAVAASVSEGEMHIGCDGLAVGLASTSFPQPASHRIGQSLTNWCNKLLAIDE